MVTNYFTLRALCLEWAPALAGSRLADAYSQTRDECTLVMATPDAEWTFRFSTRRAFPYAIRSEGYHRARRNVATLFESALGVDVAGIRIAERDRLIVIDLVDTRRLLIPLYGSRANVLLTNPEGLIEEAFQRETALAGTPAPRPVPAPEVTDSNTFAARWPAGEKDLARALSRVMPLFDRDLAEETLHRAPINPEAPDFPELFKAARAVEAELLTPEPCIYWDGDRPAAFSLIPLQALAGLRLESFQRVDHAIATFVRRRLAHDQYQEIHAPLLKQLQQARQHYQSGVERMLESLAAESRADRYEHWGHLLMAQPAAAAEGLREITVPDLFGGAEPITIPLEPERTRIENARMYYEKARHTREARAHAEDRLVTMEERAETAGRLLATLQTLRTAAEVRQFTRDEAPSLEPFLSNQDSPLEDRLPFRRFDLGQGFEVWVGKNAQQNDALTLQHARKFDFWLHARGVPGSHVVLRRPGRTTPVPHPILERAAGIAAYFSKARGSALVPVIVAERKHLRKPRGAAPGAVVVEREDVVIVPPGLPESGP